MSQASKHRQACIKYEKKPKGFLMRVYRNMQSRVTGVQKKKAHLYMGKGLLTREDFYEWALGDPQFNQLFKTWEKSDYDRRLTPSINRINPDIGYEKGNIEWITHSENSSIAAANRKTYFSRWSGKLELTKIGRAYQ